MDRPALREEIEQSNHHNTKTVGKTIFIITFFSLIMIAIGTVFIESYGAILFLGVPFFIGFYSTSLAPRGIDSVFRVGCLSTFIIFGLLALGLLVFAIEGMICLIMAAPISIVMSAIGFLFGKLAYGLRTESVWKSFGWVVLITPLMMGAEKALAPDPSVFLARTTIEIDAPPEVVWQHVIQFDELTEEPGFLFEKGIAYPIRARIEGEGVGAIRYCEFSTGPFVEPIIVWEEPWLLRFDVTETPSPISEWNPFHEIAPAHVKDYFVSEQGQFLLYELPNGRTRLEGSTWYRHHVQPGIYWKLWSDAIIHRIHGRVLRHIKAESEKNFVKE